MRKPVLGRGLGRLMQKPPGSQPTEEADALAPGLRILIRGTEAIPPPTVTTDAANVGQQPERAPAIPDEAKAINHAKATSTATTTEQPDMRIAWIPVAGVVLLLVDVALVIWTVSWLKDQANPSGWQIAGCVSSTFAGCLAGMLGVRLLIR